MRIEKVYIDHFGKLSNFELNFDQQLTILKQDNGWGKTTLSMFIKVIFYGFDPYNKKDKIEKNERLRYQPWGGGTYGGYVIFSDQKNTYKITRTFGLVASKDTFEIIDTKTGAPSSNYSSDIGQQLFHLNANAFERTVLMNHNGLEDLDKKSILERLTQMLQNTNEDDTFERVQTKLKSSIAQVENIQHSGLLPQAVEKLNTLMREKENIEQANNLLKENDQVLKEHKNALRDIEQKRLILKQDIATAQKESERQKLTDIAKGLQNNEEDAQEKYNALSQPFIHEPDESFVEEMTKLATMWQNTQTVMKETQTQKSAQGYEKLNQLFAHQVPTDEEFEFAFAANNEIATLQKHNSNAPFSHAPEQPKKSWLAWVFYALAIACFGVGIGLFAILLPLTLLLFFIGIALTFFGAMQSLKRYVNQTNMQQLPATAQEGIARVQQLKNQLEEFLQKYYLKSEISSYLSALINLQKDAARYNEQVAQEQIRLDKLQSLLTRGDGLWKQLSNALATVYITEPTNPVETALTLPLQFGELQRAKMALLQCKQQRDTFLEQNKEILSAVPVKGVTLEQLEQQDQLLLEELKQAVQNKSALEAKNQKLMDDLNRLPLLNDQVKNAQQEVEELKNRFFILQQTLAFLNTARDNINSKYLKPVLNAFLPFVKQLDIEKMGHFVLNKDLQLMLEMGSKTVEVGYFSKGYKDMLEIALRMALIEVLFENERPFLILDDPFVNLDDTKTQYAYQLLKSVSEKYQVLYLTCHQSRAFETVKK